MSYFRAHKKDLSPFYISFSHLHPAMSNIDKSLDELIAAKSQKRQQDQKKLSQKKVVSSTGKVGKSTKIAKLKAKDKAQKRDKAVAAPADVDDASFWATRIIVSNLPPEITEAQVRTFFAQHVGAIRQCIGSYTSKGRSTGTFTITFRKEGLAKAAMDKYDGTPIDKGATRMSVLIVLEAANKPLAARLQLKAREEPKQAKSKPRAASGKDKSAKSKVSTIPADASSGRKRRLKKTRTIPRTKTAAELDAEMDDYFAAAPETDIIA